VSLSIHIAFYFYFSHRERTAGGGSWGHHLTRDLKSGAILNCDVSLLLDFEIPSDCHKGERKSITRSS
jgi:hypothetical protein